MDRRPEMRRTMTLSEQLSVPDPIIRDFLTIPDDDDDIDGERRPSTLMDVIDRDRDSDGEGEGSPTAAGAGVGGGMINWKPLRDRLRLRRAAGVWTTPSPKAAAPSSAGSLTSSNSSHSSKYNYSPGEAAAAFSRTFSRAPSLRATPTFSRVTSTRVVGLDPASAFSRTRRPVADDEDEDEDDDDDEEEEDGKKGEEAPSAQMSLMSLLEQTDGQWDDDEEEEGTAGGGAVKSAAGGDEEEDGGEEEMVHVCCVCMVRHKGAAFIPCGHTFCRLCSRELWVSRGNCPLCNGFIQEILDIF